MAAAGQQFVKEQLTMEALRCFWYQALVRYAELYYSIDLKAEHAAERAARQSREYAEAKDKEEAVLLKAQHQQQQEQQQQAAAGGEGQAAAAAGDQQPAGTAASMAARPVDEWDNPDHTKAAQGGKAEGQQQQQRRRQRRAVLR